MISVFFPGASRGGCAFKGNKLLSTQDDNGDSAAMGCMTLTTSSETAFGPSCCWEDKARKIWLGATEGVYDSRLNGQSCIVLCRVPCVDSVIRGK